MVKNILIGLAIAAVIVVLLALGFGAFGSGSDGFSLQCITVQGKSDCQYASQKKLPQVFAVDVRTSTIGANKILTIQESSGARCWLLDPATRLPVDNFDCSNGVQIPAMDRLLSVLLPATNAKFVFSVQITTPPTPAK